MDIDKRAFDIALQIEERDESKNKIGGYAAVFNARTELYPKWFEEIAPGAFAESLQADDVRALWSHNPDFPLGRTKNGSLKLWEDDRGLGFELQLPDTSTGRDVGEMVRSGLITGMSFGFVVKDQQISRAKTDNDINLRVVRRAKLYEVSPVTWPAYDASSVSARTLQEIQDKDFEEFEEQLDDEKAKLHGFKSRARALMLAATVRF